MIDEQGLLTVCGFSFSIFTRYQYIPIQTITIQTLPQAFNYIANKGYARMSREDEKHWVDLMNVIHDSVKGGMKYNTGTLLMVLSRPMDSTKSPKTE
mmetsp:Transcript_42743/g.103380  ORF Transcript_42743/g.103380 Transcript_42743/m.103380 type:complete len:97 (+) Transcript_42743:49-339(+)